MMKHATALLMTAALGLGAAQTAAPQPLAAPVQTQAADSSLSDASITIETGRYQGPLSSLLGAIAQAAGYVLVLEVNVDTLGTDAPRPVAYSFRDKPFNEVWPLLMDVYGLNYSVTQLGGQPVLRVSNASVQRVVDLNAAEANYVVERAKVFFGSPAAAQGQAQVSGDTGTAATPAVRYEFDSQTLRVIADTVTNRVIIRGNNQEVREVEAFVRDLDASAAAQQQAQQDLYGTGAGATRREVYAANSDAAALRTFLAAQYPGLRVSAVPGGRSLVLEGNTATVQEAMSFLMQVDPAAGATTQRVFQLVNANAKDLADTLTATLARDLTAATSTPAANTAATGNSVGTSTGNNPVNVNVSTAVPAAVASPSLASILPDVRTNTLIVRGTAAQVAQVAELIPTLDVRVPQVNLQVRIQEITETAQRSLGVDWQAGFGGFRVGIVGSGASPTGLTATFDPTQSLVGFNIFPTLNALETQSLSKRVYDGMISMQSGQRSLEASNGSRNSSDGAAATIKSGGKLELNIPDGEGGSIEKVIDYGVILDFFEPVVAPDGTITLRVRGQVNDLLNEDALTPGALPYLLRFSNSEAQTRISFKAGETVLLSGLLGTTESNTKAGLPFFSMIPGIGALAGNQSTNRDSTQMLFVITGDIIE
ncbi:secretin N-terminal domain-containing protein [Deinococcus radiophilus]|uniref:Secretin n=1 Tax=Deinococcus radiophilus TaxID=32062 RepID=A0A3S0K9R4_9DEIO|nr:secretin N-terminal domain-containing protein [Deinococcus radiophilus]RTR25818.1 secretin [Deinococcus radiophilus]UFA50864.1 secretin [Deinococcus radiophilus]